jgi:hypothetical protein
MEPMLASAAKRDEKDALLDVAQLADYLNVSSFPRETEMRK